MGIRIKQLSPAVANQIAAGEVIERPASVVKELLENALDAGADSISIEIGHGGLNQIKISDNGFGILPEDLPLAVAAHATSKISQLDDLYALESMGFRGEALASIASVSKLSIVSKTAEQDHATRLDIVETEVKLTPTARTTGTTLEVMDLFFNAPVRKKFLKTEKLEFLAIEGVVKRFALSAPYVAIQLKHNGKIILNLPKALCDESKLGRIAKIFGNGFVKEACYFEVDHGAMQLSGWISGSGCQRSQNDRQWVYINHRMVKDKLLHHAIKQAYEGILHPGRFPACLLYFTLDTKEVDVNVHPTKHEVRFQQPRLVHDFFTTHLTQALKSESITNVIYQEKTVHFKEPIVYELKERAPVFHENVPWVILNNQYGIVFYASKPYLIDMNALQRQVSMNDLAKHEMPLLSRPLLVPMHYPVSKGKLNFSKIIQKTLQAYGISIDIVDETVLKIRSIPVLLPQLNIKNFLDAVFNDNLTDDRAILEQLSYSQWVDARYLSMEEKNTLYLFLENIGFSQTPFCKELTSDDCRKWIKSFV